MIVGIGLDHVDIERFRELLERQGPRIRQRVFTAGEQDYADGTKIPVQAFAARFAAKEAAMKALGTGWAKGVSFTEIEVRRDELGAPSVHLQGVALERAEKLGVKKTWLSLSHTDTVAMAVVVLES